LIEETKCAREAKKKIIKQTTQDDEESRPSGKIIKIAAIAQRSRNQGESSGEIKLASS